MRVRQPERPLKAMAYLPKVEEDQDLVRAEPA